MASGTEYAQEYQRAQIAYMNGSYEEAAHIIDRLVEEFPSDPSACLLRGHIYCYGLQQFDVAREQYQSVLNLTTDQEFISYANQGLDHIKEQAGDLDATSNGSGDRFDQALNDSFDGFDDDFESFSSGSSSSTTWQDSESLDSSSRAETPDFSLGNIDFDLDEEPVAGSPSDQFAAPLESETITSLDNPFDDPSVGSIPVADSDPFQIEIDPFLSDSSPLQDDFGQNDTGNFAAGIADEFPSTFDDFDQAFAPLDFPDESQPQFNEPQFGGFGVEASTAISAPPPEAAGSLRSGLARPPAEDETLFMGGTGSYDDGEETLNTPFDSSPEVESDFGLGVTDGIYANAFADSTGSSSSGQSSVDFLDEFDEFDDLGNLSDFDLSENSAGFTRPAVGADFGLPSSGSSAIQDSIGSLDFSGKNIKKK